jgi:glycosyltransferase involved in cell wall biosynthesis
MEMDLWHLLTGEFPPKPGGVGDYTARLAEALVANGRDVHVWCPADGAGTGAPGVAVHNVLGSLSLRDLRRADRLLDRFPSPRRLLVQWVPHAFGYRSMNLHFCLWVWKRAAVDGDEVEVMVHEPFLPFSGPARLRAVAGVHRAMTLTLLRATARIWLSIPAWERKLEPYLLGRDVEMRWLPVPSNIVPVQDHEAVKELRSALTAAPVLLGHFGTYGPWISEQLRVAIGRILESDPSASVLLLGRNGDEFREILVRGAPRLAARLHAPGALSPSDLSLHLQACDIMIQPFPDGISTRRGTTMACLAHGLPIVSTVGELTESLWVGSESAALVPAGDATALADAVLDLVSDGDRRASLRLAAKRYYDEHFAMSHTVGMLLSVA